MRCVRVYSANKAVSVNTQGYVDLSLFVYVFVVCLQFSGMMGLY